MNMRHVFIINPAAGRHDKTGEIVAAIEKVCKSRLLEYASGKTVINTTDISG